MDKNQKTPSSLLQGMPWTPHDETDVRDRWRKYGWKPKAETDAAKAPGPEQRLVLIKRLMKT